MRRLLFIFPALLLLAAPPLVAQPLPLSLALDAEFYGGSPWDDGLWEVVSYDAVVHSGGDETTRTLALHTKPIALTTEFYTEADYPTAQKPILPALKQVAALMPHPDAPADSYGWVAITALLEPQRMLRLTTTHSGERGITAKDFFPTLRRPMQKYSSPRDGEGAGERVLSLPPTAVFEEQLPVVLRALKFENDLKASFLLVPNQMTDSAAEPRPSPARLTVQEAPQSWVVLVESQDQRAIRFEFSRQPPYLLQSLEHTDGRRWELRSSERRATWN